jgi:hypothetical protein
METTASLMWMPAHTTTLPGPTRESAWHERANRRENDRGIECRGGASVDDPAQTAQAQCELLGRRVARRRERIHLAGLMNGDLRDDVRRGAESVETDPPRVAGHPVRSKADQPGTQQRRGLRIAVRLGQLERVPRVGDGVLGIPAVELIAGEASLAAQVLPALPAEAALIARVAEPRDTNPVADGKRLHPVADPIDDADDP